MNAKVDAFIAAQDEALVDAFESAVIEMQDLGAIPEYSSDREEQEEIDKTRRRIKDRYRRAKAALLEALCV